MSDIDAVKKIRRKTSRMPDELRQGLRSPVSEMKSPDWWTLKPLRRLELRSV